MRNAIPELIEKFHNDESKRKNLYFTIVCNELEKIINKKERLIQLIKKQTLCPLSYDESKEMEELEKFFDWLHSFNYRTRKPT